MRGVALAAENGIRTVPWKTTQSDLNSEFNIEEHFWIFIIIKSNNNKKKLNVRLDMRKSNIIKKCKILHVQIHVQILKLFQIDWYQLSLRQRWVMNLLVLDEVEFVLKDFYIESFCKKFLQALKNQRVLLLVWYQLNFYNLIIQVRILSGD